MIVKRHLGRFEASFRVERTEQQGINKTEIRASYRMPTVKRREIRRKVERDLADTFSKASYTKWCAVALPRVIELQTKLRDFATDKSIDDFRTRRTSSRTYTTNLCIYSTRQITISSKQFSYC